MTARWHFCSSTSLSLPDGSIQSLSSGRAVDREPILHLSALQRRKRAGHVSYRSDLLCVCDLKEPGSHVKVGVSLTGPEIFDAMECRLRSGTAAQMISGSIDLWVNDGTFR
jgi:hypothetical protein